MKFYALLLLTVAAATACSDDDATDFAGSFSYQTTNGISVNVQSYNRPAVVRNDSLFLSLEASDRTLRIDANGTATGADLPATIFFGSTNASGGLSATHVGLGTVRLSTFATDDRVEGTFTGELSSPLDPADSFEITDGEFRVGL